MKSDPANTPVKGLTPLRLSTETQSGQQYQNTNNSIAPAPSIISPLKIIIDKAEYEVLKAKNKELQGNYNAIACSYSMLERDVKEVEEERDGLKVALLQAKAEIGRQNGMFAKVLEEAQAVKQGQM